MAQPNPKTIARILGKSLAVKSATLSRITPGARTAGAVSGGTNPTTATYAARGFVATLRKKKIGGTDVEETDRVVCLLAATIADGQKPKTGDKIAIDGSAMRVIDVERDPFGATYLCLCRE